MFHVKQAGRSRASLFHVKQAPGRRERPPDHRPTAAIGAPGQACYDQTPTPPAGRVCYSAPGRQPAARRRR